MVVAVVVLGATTGIIAAIARNQGGSGASKPSTSTTSSTLTGAQLRERETASAWNTEATAAFGGDTIQISVSTILNGQNDFKTGKLSGPEFGVKLTPVLTAFVMARDEVTALPPFPLAPIVKEMYIRAAELYVEIVHLLQAETAVPLGPVGDQMGSAALRVKELGDRIFDRGHTVIDGYLRVPSSPDVEVRLPEEVPQWSTEGKGAGPPLEPSAPPPPASLPSVRQATRPVEARSRWLDSVHATVTPPAPEVADAVRVAEADKLRTMADRLDAASEHLRAEPDPQGQDGREESARYRLALLVREEAARTGQLMVLARDPVIGAQLRLSAQRLLLISDGVVPAGLGVSGSGLDATLLTQP